MKIDIHQHLWTDPLVEALAQRDELPFVRHEQGLTVLFLAGERPYVIEREDEDRARRAQLVHADGLDRALVCLSSPLGIESLPRTGATKLIDAYLDGALALGDPFGAWGPVALDRPDAADVDRALERGCCGISLPAGALGSLDMLAHLSPTLVRVQEQGAPLFVHPGPGSRLPTHEATLGDPLWWPALTRYVAEVHAAWFVFVTAARRLFPELRVVFAMLAGLAPLHTERLLARGGPEVDLEDPLIFYDTSCNGPYAISLMDRLVGVDRLVYGSDRPVVDPGKHGVREVSDWARLASNSGRLFADEPSPQPLEPDTVAVGWDSAQACRRAGAGTPMKGALAEIPRPLARNLCGQELERFVSELAGRPELWIDLVKHDRTQRVYEELFSDDHITAWLICWMEDHDTGFHDHDISCGAVAVVSGSVREERLTLAGPPANRLARAGESFHFSAADIHRVRHVGSDPAVTLHVYSPPLLTMGAYVVREDGRLERQKVSTEEELRPLGEVVPTP